MKFAALILAHKNEAQLLRLIQSLQAQAFDVYVHMDKRAAILPIGKNVYWFRKYTTNWGGYSLTKATLLLFKEAVKQRYDYYFLISGQDYLLKNKGAIEDRLQKQPGIYLEAYKLPFQSWGGDGGLNRYLYRHFLDSKFKWLRDYSFRIQYRFKLKRKPPKGVDLYGGSDWFTIDHPGAVYFLEKEPAFRRFYKYTFHPAESIIHTILMNSEHKDRVMHDNLRKIEWHRGPEHPRIWRTTDVEELKKSSCVIARKFDIEVDSLVLDAIDRYSAE